MQYSVALIQVSFRKIITELCTRQSTCEVMHSALGLRSPAGAFGNSFYQTYPPPGATVKPASNSDSNCLSALEINLDRHS